LAELPQDVFLHFNLPTHLPLVLFALGLGERLALDGGLDQVFVLFPNYEVVLLLDLRHSFAADAVVVGEVTRLEARGVSLVEERSELVLDVFVLIVDELEQLFVLRRPLVDEGGGAGDECVDLPLLLRLGRREVISLPGERAQ